MKRVRQHVIEEESRKEFANILPNEWVTNDFHKDYGKDVHVEIFNENTSTGKSFIVQLKGTDKVEAKGFLIIPIKVDMLKYYASVDIPILLAFYSTKQKVFKAVWANNLIYTLNISPEQKVVYVKLDGRNSIDEAYFKKLATTFSARHAFKLNLSIKYNSELSKLFSNRILKWIQKYYHNAYEIGDYTLPLVYEIDIIENDSQIFLTISGMHSKLELDPIFKNKDISFAISPTVDAETIYLEEVELLFLLSYNLIGFNPRSSYLLLKSLIVKYNGRHKTNDCIDNIGKLAIEWKLVQELQILIEVAIENCLSNEFQYLNKNLLTYGNLEYALLFEKNLLKAIEKFSDNILIATCHYNLANLYRTQHRFSVSLTHYNKALKANPEYRKKPYLYREIGGVLFLLKKEKFAERYYRVSIAMADGQEYKIVYALIGDCLLWQGRYKAASENYLTYLQSIEQEKLSLTPYYYLYELCQEFIEMGYENNIFCKTLSDQILNNNREIKDNILTAIEAYPLNIEGWSILGVLYANEKDYVNAHFAFKNAAILSNDKADWFNTIISAHFAGLHLSGLLFFQSIVPLHGLTILDELTQFVSNELSIPIEHKAEFLQMYHSIGNEIKSIYDSTSMNLPPNLQIREWGTKYF